MAEHIRILQFLSYARNIFLPTELYHCFSIYVCSQSDLFISGSFLGFIIILYFYVPSILMNIYMWPLFLYALLGNRAP